MDSSSKYRYEADWKEYSFPEPESRFASEEELIEAGFRWMDPGEPSDGGGIPVMSDGNRLLVDTTDTNSIIFGMTGSKKSRSFVRPLIASLAAAGESMIISDIKGELATDPAVIGRLKELGYNVFFLDFRSLSSDGFNLFEYPFSLYRKGLRDKAASSVNTLIASLTADSVGSNADPFWDKTAEVLIKGVEEPLMSEEALRPNGGELLNLLQIGAFLSENGVNTLRSMRNGCLENVNNTSMTMLDSVLLSPEKTMSCIIVSAAALLQPLLSQEALIKMLSHSTFDIRDFYCVKSALFLIIPDETSAYNRVAGLVTDMLYSSLVDEFTEKYQGAGTPENRRVNFVLDEFANLKVQHMSSKISACRSRFLRFHLVLQSLSQLRSAYPDSAATIIGNCTNTLFLSSSDVELLDYISRLSGTTTISESGVPVPLVTHRMLKNLKKERNFKEAILIRGGLVFRAVLPDYASMDVYQRKTGLKPVQIPKKNHPKPPVISPERFERMIELGKLPVPFSDEDN